MENNINNKQPSDEIDLIEVIRLLWNKRWFIIKITGAFIVLGAIIVLTSTEQYKAETVILPELPETRGGASQLLRQLGGMGASLGSDGTDAVRPYLYPNILSSNPFFLHVLKQTITVDTDTGAEELEVLTYMQEYMEGSVFVGYLIRYTIRLPWTIASWFKKSKPEVETEQISEKDKIPQMSMSEFNATRALRGRINTSFDQQTWIITISAEFPDPKVAAQITKLSLDYLTEYVTDYRIAKAKQNLHFLKERHNDAQEEYHRAQLELARFNDANRHIASAQLQTEQQRLQHKFTIAFNVYNNISQQLEQARIKVFEETPIIKILEPVQVPNRRSKPRRGFTMVVFTVLGGFLGVGLVFGQIVKNNIIEKLKESK